MDEDRHIKRTSRGKEHARLAEEAIDKLWDEGIINDDVIEEWKHEHMCTPYKKEQDKD